MTLLQQYRKGNELKLNIKSTVNNAVLNKIVNDYKELLQQKDQDGFCMLEEEKELNITFIENSIDDDANEAFDLLFLSYLALLKTDFPNIIIKLYYPYFNEKREHNNYFFKLNQHRLHFLVTSKKEIFRLYKDNVEYKAKKIFLSASYIPPLPVDDVTLRSLFVKKTLNFNYLSNITNTLKGTSQEFFDVNDRELTFFKMQQVFKGNKDSLLNWTSEDLSSLYIIKALYDLYVLRYFINQHYGINSEYQIGQSIVSSKEDTESTNSFRREVVNVLTESGVFYFSDVQAYFFSLIISNSDLFKIPLSRDEMIAKVSPLSDENDLEQIKNDVKFLRAQYILIYRENLKRIISYVKDIAYGLEELAKNIIDHTISRHGIITARIYKHQPLVSLKSIDKDWVGKFDSNHKFLDINVIDSGFVNLKHSYKENLIKEKAYFIGVGEDDYVTSSLLEEYNDDIDQLENFRLDDFFNFNSVKLYHQINRTKARLGLLIFAQTILFEKGAFVSLSSNSLVGADHEGSYMYVNQNIVEHYSMEKMMPLGTHYNFIIPMKEVLELNPPTEDSLLRETSISSSVFMELQNYGFEMDSKKLLFRVEFDTEKITTDKYAKLDELKMQVNSQYPNGIIVINAKDLTDVLLNSSDWIRFLADMQFSAVSYRDIIIYNLSPDIYIEMINILKLFDKIAYQHLGFWKKDRFILFYLPVEYDGQFFWFNSVLTASRYGQFVGLNDEIGLYHLNLNSVVDQDNSQNLELDNVEISESLLFSKSKKLLNFELLIQGDHGMSLFEDTIGSLINIPIADGIHEDQ